jgi:predicted PurR-regulated permease PerM
VAVSALNAGTGLIGIVFQAFTVALFAFYLTANGPRVRRAVCSLLRPERQRTVLAVWDLAIDKTGGYVYSRALLAAVSALVTFLLLTVLGVPYALALALWVGLVSQFVPAVGTYLAGVVPVFVALLNDPIDAVWVLGFILLYQQVENYFLAPRITAQTMQLNAAVAFGSVLAGAAILGPIGALLALPVAASLQAFISTYARRYEVLENPLTEQSPPNAAGKAKSMREPRTLPVEATPGPSTTS